MPRTTVNIDAPILRQLKALQGREKIPMGQLISQLLAQSLSRAQDPVSEAELRWNSRPMHALVDLQDKERVQAILDGLE